MDRRHLIAIVLCCAVLAFGGLSCQDSLTPQVDRPPDAETAPPPVQALPRQEKANEADLCLTNPNEQDCTQQKDSLKTTTQPGSDPL